MRVRGTGMGLGTELLFVAAAATVYQFQTRIRAETLWISVLTQYIFMFESVVIHDPM